MTLRLLFTIHAILTFAAGIVLVAAPGAIPGMIGIHVEPKAYLLCYLLAAMEFGVAALSWGARTITDAKALRIIVMSCIVLTASGLLGVYAFAGGVSGVIWGNVALRALVVALFARYGLNIRSNVAP